MISTVFAPSTIPPGRPLDVIVADDEASDNFLLSLAAVDAKADINFTFAEDGEELLRLLVERVDSGKVPDVIVLDIRMPRCSGLEAMEVISSSEVLRRIPVVIFTTSIRAVDKERSLRLGATSFVVKPSSYQELVEFTCELAGLVRG